MSDFLWYRTPVTSTGTATANSSAVTIWFGVSPPPPGSGPYAVVIIDSDGDGLISSTEWQAATGSGGGRNLGGDFALFDFTPPNAGFLYTSGFVPSGTTGLLDGLTQNFDPIDPENLVICFLEGTRIATPDGSRPIETLAAGDLVMTLDHGPQPIRAVWAGRRRARGDYLPVRIPRGQFGATDDLFLSQNHRVLIQDSAVELLFGFPEALVMAKSLGLKPDGSLGEDKLLRYYHLLLDRHEVVLANGVTCETFLPVSYLTSTRQYGDLETLLFLSEAAPADGAACRPYLRHWEGLLLSRHLRSGEGDAKGPIATMGMA